MEQYIPKSVLVTEIEKLKKKNDAYEKPSHIADVCYKEILSLIDTLEVKEVDIEDSIKETLAQKYIDYTFRRHNIDPESKEGQLIYYAYMHGMNQCLTQLRTQKGE